MKAVLAIKFKEDYSDKEKIKKISGVLESVGISSEIMVKDYEKRGAVRFTPQELMKKTFEIIDASDMLITEFSEKGVGLGIEAGYAFAKGKPIYVIAKEGSDISTTLAGIARVVIFYQNIEEVGEKIEAVLEK